MLKQRCRAGELLDVVSHSFRFQYTGFFIFINTEKSECVCVFAGFGLENVKK